MVLRASSRSLTFRNCTQIQTRGLKQPLTLQLICFQTSHSLEQDKTKPP